MTDKKTEALKLALEWDKRRKYIMPYVVRDAIREALAEQPAPQPVDMDALPHQDWCRWWKHGDMCNCGADASPPASKPLTGEEMNQIEARWDASMHGSKIAFVVRETEAAHGIKENT